MRFFRISLMILLAMPCSAAIRTNSTTDAFTTTTNLPTNSAYTVMGWFQLVVDNNAFSALIAYGTGANDKELQTIADGTTIAIWDGGDTVTGSALTVGTWYHMTFTFDASNVRSYVNGVLDVTNPNTTSPTTTLRIGTNESSEFLNGRFSCLKIYSAVLTASEILNEMRHCRPLRTQNLNRWLPTTFNVLAADALDLSGNGANMTVTATPLVEAANPPVSW